MLLKFFLMKILSFIVMQVQRISSNLIVFYHPEHLKKLCLKQFNPLSLVSLMDIMSVSLHVSFFPALCFIEFLDGQTGSGKTFTMEGYGNEIGVSPRAISELFNIVNNCTEDWNYTVIYNHILNLTLLDYF
jgi:hypothetical protein